MEMKLELVPIPVADVDRAKTFYVERLGFVEDVDVQPAAGVRIVQLTPAGSACSIGMGTGLPAYDEMPPAPSRACTWWLPTSSRPALSWSAAALRSAPSRTWAEVKYARLADPDGNTLTLQEMAWRTGDKF
jgi:catechol 2,3-dioxygenase-like lactoylglutathione lyase family enzyme